MRRWYEWLIGGALLVLLLAACEADWMVSPTTIPTPVSVPLAALVEPSSLSSYPAQRPLVIRFTEAMDPRSASSPLIIEPPTKGVWAWNAEATELTFRPERNFVPGQRYRIALDPALAATSGVTLAQQSDWHIRIARPPVVFNGQVGEAGEYSQNANGVVSLQPTILIAFNQEMQPETVVGAVQISPTVAYTATAAGRSVRITPTEKLAPGASYAVTISSTAQSLDGSILNSPYTLNFKVARLDVSAYDWLSMPEGARVRFNYALDPESVQAAWQLTPALTGTLSWDEAGRVYTWTAGAPVTPGLRVRLSLNGEVYSPNGDVFTRTQSTVYQAPPLIAYVSPSGKAKGPHSVVDFKFNREMDEASLRASFHITPAVAGTLSVTAKSLLFTPESCLVEGSVYEMSLDSTLQDATGHAWLEGPYRTVFTVGAADERASFGYRSRLQVMPADIQRAMPVEVQAGSMDEAPCLSAVLYRLTWGEFWERYQALLDDESPDRFWESGVVREDLSAFLPVEDLELAATLPVSYEEPGRQAIVFPEDVAPGLYVLELRGGSKPLDRMLTVLTQRFLMVKAAGPQVTAWVTEAEGEPAVDVPVTFYDPAGKVVLTGRTNAEGIFSGRAGGEAMPALATAGEGKDIAISGMNQAWSRDLWNSGGDGWGPPRINAPTPQEWLVYLYTDRLLYRAGQTVAFKGWVRRDGDGELEPLPQGQAVTVRLLDARGNLVQSRELTTGRFGTISGTFALAEGGTLGNYTLEAVVAGERHHLDFKVEDYRKPDYQVQVTADRAQVLDGETITLTVSSAYWFGQPVAGAAITLNQYMEARNYWDEEPRWYFQKQLLVGKTDAAGFFTVTVPISPVEPETMGDYLSWYDENPWEYAFPAVSNWGRSLWNRWGFEAVVDDDSRQAVSGLVGVQVLENEERLEMSTLPDGVAVGMPFTVTATVLDLDGAPVSGRLLTATLELDDEWKTPLITQTATTGEYGRVTFSSVLTGTESYVLHIGGRDAAGRELSRRVQIYGRDPADLSEGWGDYLILNADRLRYAVGETALLTVTSPFSGPALLTVERGQVRRSRLIALQAPETPIKLPIEAGDGPNIFVKVSAWHESKDYYSGFPYGRLADAVVMLQVPPAERPLSVTVAADRADYAPGEPATVTVRVLDAEGRPVQAELSLAMTDVGLEALAAGNSLPIDEAVYAMRENAVLNYDSLALRVSSGENGGGGRELLPGAALRSDFPDTALWIPALETDAEGWVTTTVQLPDSITQWRVTARAVTVGNAVGEGGLVITTGQELAAQPLFPRQLTVGDVVSLTARVQATEAASGALTATLSGMPVTTAVQSAIVGGGVPLVLNWTAMVTETGLFTPMVQVESETGLADAIQAVIPVQLLAAREQSGAAGLFQQGLTLPVTLPVGVLPTSRVRLTLNPAAGVVLEGVDYLVGYPYGCVEQTTSRLVADLVAVRTLRQLELARPDLEAQLPEWVNASVQRIYGFQHENGGWGWWYESEGDTYQTAWVLFGLGTTAGAGYEVDPAVAARGAAWLDENMGQKDLSLQAYALYSMAAVGHPDLTATLKLVERTEELDAFGLAALALALDEVGEQKQAGVVIDILAAQAIQQDGLVSWAAATENSDGERRMSASEIHATALALSALARVSPGHELAGGAVLWLLAHRTGEGWGNTNETAFAVLALTDYLAEGEVGPASGAYSVELNGAVLAKGKLGAGQQTVEVELTPGDFQTGTNVLQVNYAGAGLSYRLVQDWQVAQTAVEPAGPISVTRIYRNAVSGEVITQATAGQLVDVEVSVVMPAVGSYVIVEDSLPGGLEPLNERLSRNAARVDPYVWGESEERSYAYDYKEVRAGRVDFFFTRLTKGPHQFHYLARAVAGGQFTAVPAQCWAMYDPALWGMSESVRFAIQP